MDRDRPANARPRSVSTMMVATLANDLRNLLTALVRSIDALRRSVPPDLEADRTFAELDKAIDGAFHVSDTMVALVRPLRAESAIADLNEVIGQARALVQRLAGAHIRIRLNLTPLHAVVRAASIDIEWLLLNLASNAADAMRDGGVLTIETDLVRIPATLTDGTDERELSYGLLSITDTGPGMKQARAIEPFFSTKPGALGLGLTSAALTVRRLGGILLVASTGPEGTRLEVYLPAQDHQPDPVRAAS